MSIKSFAACTYNKKCGECACVPVSVCSCFYCRYIDMNSALIEMLQSSLLSLAVNSHEF